jgi:hypothetical protein
MTRQRATPNRFSTGRRPLSGQPPAPMAPTPGASVDPASGRSRTSLYLFLVSAPLLGGAWIASVDHVRLFASQYPLWIILALDGIVAALAGILGLFYGDADRPTDDDSETVRVSRAEWESVRRRLAAAQRSTRSRRS